MKCFAIFLIVVFLNHIECSKILMVHPFPSRSHYILGNTIARSLVEAGHDVTMVSPYEEKNPPKNGTYRNIVLTGTREDFTAHNLFVLENVSPFIQVIPTNYLSAYFTSKIFEHKNFQKLIHAKEEKFDAVIVEIFYNDALNGLAHHFKAPLILFSAIGASAWVNPVVGNTSPPSYIPDVFLNFTSNMNFFQRVINWLLYVTTVIVRDVLYFPLQNRVMKEYLPQVPDLYKVNYNASIVLLNSHESINQPVPHVPCMVNIGGFHVTPPKKLPQNLKEFMDSAKEGVVYFSLGSNLKPSTMPVEKRQAILNALGKFKHKVLWKWNEDTLPGKPDNVMLSKWFPQQDVLAHPNLRLFITHGGLLSIIETVYHGVPVLVLPIFGDQKMNAARVEMSGFGVTLAFSELTENKLTNALTKMLNDPKYRNNAKWRSQLLHDRPIKPMDLARYWIEFVIRHKGAPHLRVEGLYLPWYKCLLLDVISFVIFVGFFLITTLYLIGRTLLFKRSKNNSKIKKN